LAPFLSAPKVCGGLSLSSIHRSIAVGKKLYCGNLGYNVSNSDLDQLFSQFGTVQSAEVINDRDTGRSKGFGFVEMGSDAEAQAAIAGINGTEHDGRTLTVNEARPREDRRGGGGGGGGRGGYGGGRGGGGGGRGGRY
jgi:RNA recognition motif-containing protein